MKSGPTFLIGLVAQTLVVGPAAAGCSGAPPAAASRESAFVRQVVERMPAYLRDFSVPGGAVAVIENGKVILARGFGMADAATKTPVSERTRFNIGSTSKSVSAWGAMRLVTVV